MILNFCFGKRKRRRKNIFIDGLAFQIAFCAKLLRSAVFSELQRKENITLIRLRNKIISYCIDDIISYPQFPGILKDTFDNHYDSIFSCIFVRTIISLVLTDLSIHLRKLEISKLVDSLQDKHLIITPILEFLKRSRFSKKDEPVYLGPLQDIIKTFNKTMNKVELLPTQEGILKIDWYGDFFNLFNRYYQAIEPTAYGHRFNPQEEVFTFALVNYKINTEQIKINSEIRLQKIINLFEKINPSLPAA